MCFVYETSHLDGALVAGFRGEETAQRYAPVLLFGGAEHGL